MIDRRPTTQVLRNGLKLATRLSLQAAGGAAALVREKLVRVGTASLSMAGNAVDEEASERFVALDVALDLDFLAGEPFHARALAAAQDYDLVPRKTPRSRGEFGLTDMRGLKTEMHDVEEAMFEALADGRICPKDRSEILMELDDLDRVSRQIREKLEGGL